MGTWEDRLAYATLQLHNTGLKISDNRSNGAMNPTFFGSNSHQIVQRRSEENKGSLEFLLCRKIKVGRQNIDFQAH